MPDDGTDNQAWIGNVPSFMSDKAVAYHILSNGFGRPINVYLQPGCGGLQWGVVTFRSWNQAARFKHAGSRHNALFWPNGKYAVIREAEPRGAGRGGQRQRMEAACHTILNEILEQRQRIYALWECYSTYTMTGAQPGPNPP